jgi:predicted transposase YdaD
MLSTRTFFRKERDMFYKEGRELGKEEGRVAGKEEGIRIGKEQGEVEAKKQFAKILKELGHEVGYISQVLNVPVEEVDN